MDNLQVYVDNPGWQTIFQVMKILAGYCGGDFARLVVGFDN
ncbi:hypothetical protein [Marinicella meishanensis]|nr:hypothetical protein [Marinicella sp. NBU2979]